jgi:hypothetical protein
VALYLHVIHSKTYRGYVKPRIIPNAIYKACPSESGTEVGVPLFPAVELWDFSGRWQCMSGEVWYILDSGSVLLIETEVR